MALKPGDIVRLTLSPTVKIAEYQYLKPSVTLERVIGDDTVSSLEEMNRDLRALAAQAVLNELNITNDLYDALGDKDIKSLQDYCLKEIGYGTEGQSTRRGDPSRKPGPVKGLVKGLVKKPH